MSSDRSRAVTSPVLLRQGLRRGRSNLREGQTVEVAASVIWLHFGDELMRRFGSHPGGRGDLQHEKKGDS